MKQAVESVSDRMRRMREAAAEPELTLAERINAAHRDYHQLLHGALKRAIQIGEMLVEAKQQVKHGQWLPWLKQNCPLITDRTASNYIRVAANQNEISDLSGVAEAIKFLSGSQSGGEDPPVRALPAATKSAQVSRQAAAALPPSPAATIIEAEFEEVEEEDLPHPALLRPAADPNVKAAEQQLRERLSTMVRLVPEGDGKTRIEIDCSSDEELSRIFDAIMEAGDREASDGVV